MSSNLRSTYHTYVAGKGTEGTAGWLVLAIMPSPVAAGSSATATFTRTAAAAVVGGDSYMITGTL